MTSLPSGADRHYASRVRASRELVALLPLLASLLLLSAGAAGCSKEDAERAREKTEEVGGKALDKTRDVGGAALQKTREVGGEALEKGRELGGKALDKTRKVGTEAAEKARRAGGAVKAAGETLIDEAAKNDAGP